MADSGSAATATTAATTATEYSLLSNLESSPDLSSIHHLITSYLQPFLPVLKKPSKIDAETSTLLRSLAKKFISFLSKALSLIPKRLTETPKIDSSSASQLFESYRLCLDCLEAISSQLSCKPHSVHIQRVRLIHCYENWGRYDEAQSEGVLVLDFVAKLSGGKLQGRVVPKLGKDNGDKDVGLLVLEVVMLFVKCIANSRSKNEEDYRKVLSLVNEIQPWLSFIGVDGYDKLHKVLVSYMSKCALFLVGDLGSFDGNLTCKFCIETFSEYKKSSLSDQILKFTHKICGSLFMQLDNDILWSVKILTCVLGAMANECEINNEKFNRDFLELVDYCAMKCRNATVDFCVAVATHFNNLARDFSKDNLLPVDMIMRLYAITLSTGDLNYYSRGGNTRISKAGNDISFSKLLLDMDCQLQTLRTSITTHTTTYMPFYFKALKFLCEPLSELINSKRKEILCGFDDMSFPIKLPNIENAFHHFRLIFYAYCKSEKEISVYDDNSRAVLAVATAAFTLSFTTKQNFEANTTYLMELISADSIQANGLKYLYASLHNVGIVLYKTDRLKEATKAIKLCCQAAWNCVIQYCKMFVSCKDESSSDLSDDTITTFAIETYAKSAFLLDIVHQSSSEETGLILIDSLKCWYAAHNWFEKIPIPLAMVKQWVKIQCKEYKDSEAYNKVPTIYSLMSSFLTMSKEILGTLLEQELQLYMEMKSLNPKLSQIMQTTISNTLLKKFYTTKDNGVQKSRILIANARESRASGIEGLDECIRYLSEVISSMTDMYNKDKDACGQVCNLLAEAYCLHALCIQEAEPNSKLFVQDIRKALKLWLSQEHSQSAEKTCVVSRNTLTLLYHVGDLLSLKGFMEDDSDIYEMMIRFFTWKNVPLKESLAMLWQSRSLGHPLCTSPINDAFILTLSQHCDSVKSTSTEFWISCMDRSKSLEVDFRQKFSVISTFSFSDSHTHDHTIQPHTTIDEVKHAASDLINNVPLSSKSLFLAAHLYFDLAERMVAKGSMIEALSYAKEAHCLRVKLLQKNFVYSIEQHNEIIGDNGEIIQKCGYGLKSFHMHPSAATTAWSKDGSSDLDYILTPWNVLRCYLESILQVGTIQEIVGNGFEAEALLLWGKNISCFQDLPIFLVSFSCALGKLFRKQQLWHLAQKELESAKQILANGCSLFSCLKCKLILEVTVDQQLGDLVRSHFNSTDDNKLERLSKAEIYYISAVEKLKLSEWKNCVSNPKETSSRNTMFCDSVLIGEKDVSFSSDTGSHEIQEAIQPKITRKGRKTTKILPQEQRVTCRVTRSTKQKSENAQNEVQNVVDKKQAYACDDRLIGKGTQKSKVERIVACGCEVTCVCDEVNCWHCVPSGVVKSSSLKSIIQMKWECTRRRVLLTLLVRIGRCLKAHGKTQKAHEVFLESISVLVNRSTFHPSNHKISFTFMGELIRKNVTADVFAIEHAALLYNICWFSLKSSWDNGTRNHSSDIFIPIPILVSGLKLSFILSCEVPELFQKVSRMLAVLYTLSPSNEAFSVLTSSSGFLSESQWASFFHQASLGTHLNYQLFSRLGKQKDQNSMDIDGSFLSSSTSLSLHRLAPESVLDLEEFILNFFKGLPRATILCISMLGEDYASWLRDLLPYESPTHAWIMVSRLNSDCAPVVIVLPVDSILSGRSKDEDSSSSILFDQESCDKQWRCPWGHTVIDEIAPQFRTILEGNYRSSSGFGLEDTKKNRLLWWNRRRKLDQCLSDLLRDVEDLWFGPWKHLLLGELSDNKHIDLLQKKLMKDLNSKCKIDVHDDIVKAVIRGGVHATQHVECFSELIMKKGCYIGRRECLNDESLSSVSDLLNAMLKIEEGDFIDRKPLILVPDFDIQMLPWESIPILRNQEVYRMPSVASISCTYDRCCHFQEKVGRDSAIFPMIDPLDAYYLLNPGGDLSSTEAEFGSWFKDQNLEGTTGTSPSIDELSVALKNHDLFIYLGHGSGVQYIPGGEIQKLDRCAATLLMGCSSGSLSLNGPYMPKGAPLYYLFAGSPVIIANLWDVTDKDIDRFGKAMLDAWIKARSSISIDCTQCSELSDKFKEINIEGGKRKGKKKISRSKSLEVCEEVNSGILGCKHRPKIGSFMGQARGACTLPFLIGAAPVCYGVPTGIRKKDLGDIC